MVAPDVIRAVVEQAFETRREVHAAARGLPDDELASRVATGFVARQLDTAALVTELAAQRVGDGSRKARQRCCHGPIGWASGRPGAVWWANGRARARLPLRRRERW
jgi:hypothetical protein